MLQPLARLGLALVVGTAAALLLICVQHYDGSATSAFFADHCAEMPCWQGIRPGETTADEALAILGAHPWVESISEAYASPYGYSALTLLIYWTWSDAYPFASASPGQEQGIVITDHGVVQQIYLTTGISFGDLWLALGGADGGTVDYIYDSRHLRIDNTALFAREGIAATASVLTDCTVSYPDFWGTPVYVWLQDRALLGVNNVAYPVYLRVMRTGYRHIRASFC